MHLLHKGFRKKKRCKSCYCKFSQNRIKICETCFLCRSIVCCKACNQYPTCCTRSDYKGKTTKLLENLGNSGCQSKSLKNTKPRLHPPLLDPVKLDKITQRHKLFSQSPQEPLPAGGITSAYGQKCSRAGPQSNISGFLQPTFLGPKTQQQVETYSRSEQSESIPQGAKIQMETPEIIRTSLQHGEWVTSIDLKDAYFLIAI